MLMRALHLALPPPPTGLTSSTGMQPGGLSHADALLPLRLRKVELSIDRQHQYMQTNAVASGRRRSKEVPNPAPDVHAAAPDDDSRMHGDVDFQPLQFRMRKVPLHHPRQHPIVISSSSEDEHDVRGGDRMRPAAAQGAVTCTSGVAPTGTDRGVASQLAEQGNVRQGLGKLVQSTLTASWLLGSTTTGGAASGGKSGSALVGNDGCGGPPSSRNTTASAPSTSSFSGPKLPASRGRRTATAASGSGTRRGAKAGGVAAAGVALAPPPASSCHQPPLLDLTLSDGSDCEPSSGNNGVAAAHQSHHAAASTCFATLPLGPAAAALTLPDSSGGSSIRGSQRQMQPMPAAGSAGLPPAAVPPAVATSLRVFSFDIETTGNGTGVRLLDIAACDVATGRCYESLVDPGRRFLKGVSGITYREVKGKPNAQQAIAGLVRFVEDCCSSPLGGVQAAGARAAPAQPLLVAHNGVVFDFHHLQSESKRCGLQLPSDWAYLDTLQLARALKLKDRAGSCSQASLTQFFKLPVPVTAHRALPDAQCLTGLYRAIMAEAAAAAPGHRAAALSAVAAAVQGSKKTRERKATAAAVPAARARAQLLLQGASSSCGCDVQSVWSAFPDCYGLVSALGPGPGPSEEEAEAQREAEEGRMAAVVEALHDWDLMGAREFRRACEEGSVGVGLHGERQGLRGGKAFLPVLGPSVLSSVAQGQGRSLGEGASPTRSRQDEPQQAQQAGPSQQQQQQHQQQPSQWLVRRPPTPSPPPCRPVCVLLRSLRVGFNVTLKYAYKDGDKPWWNITLKRSQMDGYPEAEEGEEAEAATEDSEGEAFDEFASGLSALLRRALGSGAGDAAKGPLKVNLRAQVIHGPVHPSSGVAPTEWSLLTGFTCVRTGKALQPKLCAAGLTPHSSSGQQRGSQVQGEGSSGLSLEEAKAANVDAVNKVLKLGRKVDVLVAPDMVWRTEGKQGVKLNVLHFFLH